MGITAALVKELREKTGCGMMDCKRALQETDADLAGAVDLLRKKGLADMEKRSARSANEGLVEAYIHPGGRVGVMLEVNCETDFVARNVDFQQFAHDVAMQVAATHPRYISREEVPEDVQAAEREIYRAQAIESGKPENILDKIADGKMEKFFQTVCLLEQSYVKDSDITVQEHLAALVGKIGENIAIRRFTRYQLGEKL